MDWFLYGNGLRHEKVKKETKNGTIVAAHVGFAKLTYQASVLF